MVFAGTPEFAVPALDALHHAGHHIGLVLTQPDRPAGRGRKFSPSPVKSRALEIGLEIRQPDTFRDLLAVKEIKDFEPDLMVVVAYGLIVPSGVLAIPRFGCINIHASLLPRWRGAAPIQRAVLAGDRQTGVSIMQMDSGLDTGPVWLQRSIPIAAADTGGSLHDRLATLGAGALMDALPAIIRGRPGPVAQAQQGACYANKLEKGEARIQWRQPAEQIERMIRAFNPWPVAETEFAGKQLRIWAATLDGGSCDGPPGSVCGWDRGGILVCTGEGLLRLQCVQLPGKRKVDAGEFANAHPLAGVCLGA